MKIITPIRDSASKFKPPRFVKDRKKPEVWRENEKMMVKKCISLFAFRSPMIC